jgi:cytochrome c556
MMNVLNLHRRRNCMSRFVRFASPALLATFIFTVAFAESHVDPTIEKAVKARKSHMTLYSFNLAPLGGMAQDKMPYDAETAARAASNLAALAAINQSGYWPEGSEAGAIEDVRAKAEIWAEIPKFEEHQQTLADVTATLAQAAGTDLESLKAAFGPVGEACGSCHKAYRVSDD